jgi:hypothetical protein
MRKRLLFLAGIIYTSVLFGSCPLDNGYERHTYYQNFFLGADSFTIKGSLYKSDGSPEEGELITITPYRNNPENWEILYHLPSSIKNEFETTINKTDKNGITLSKETIDEYYGTLYSQFQSYFYKFNGAGPAQNIKAVGIPINMNDVILIEFVGINVRDGYVGGFDYLYITEPVNIAGNYKYKYDGEDTIWYEHYDYNFSEAGWYKICTSY